MSTNVKRAPNFTAAEEATLIWLVKKHDVMNCKKTDATSAKYVFQNSLNFRCNDDIKTITVIINFYV